MRYILFLLCIIPISTLFTQSNSATASCGTFSDKVIISWDPVPNAKFYTVTRRYDAPKFTKKGLPIEAPVDILEQKTTETSYTDSAVPFGQHLYQVKAFTHGVIPQEISTKKKFRALSQVPTMGNIEINTISAVGYRKVNDEEFFLEFQKTIDSSLPRIRSMKRLNFFGEKKKGWKNGYLVYKTTGIVKRPFKVMIRYTDFVDQNLSLNGLYEVQINKLISQQGRLVGTFQIDGIYKGTVIHNLIIKGGKSVGGTYEVQQEGKAMVSIPWNITDHPLDDSQYEEALKTSLKEMS